MGTHRVKKLDCMFILWVPIEQKIRLYVYSMKTHRVKKLDYLYILWVCVPNGM